MLKGLIKEVKSFSQVEKRDFKKAYSMTSRTQAFIKLFDTINGLCSLPLPEIVLFLKGEKWITPRVQKELASKIALFISKNNPEKLIHQHFISGREFFKSGNLELARFAVKKALKIAYDFEVFDLVHELHAFAKNKLSLNLEKKVKDIELIRIEIQDLEKFGAIIKNWPMDFLAVGPKISLICRTKEDLKSRFPNYPISDKGKALFFILTRRLESLLGNWAVASVYSQKYIDLLNTSVVYQTEKENLIIQELAIFSSIRKSLGDDSGYFSTLKKIAEFRPSSFKATVMQFEEFYLRILIDAADSGNIEQGRPLIQAIESSIKRFDSEIKPKSLVLFKFHLCRLHLVLKNYNQAIRIANQFLRKKESTPIFKLFSPYFSLIRIISVFENNDFDLVDSYLTSFRRRLKKEDNLGPYFLNTISSISLLNVNPPDFDAKRLESKHLELTQMMSDKAHELHFSFFNIAFWLQSKLENTSLHIILQKENERMHSLVQSALLG